MPVFAHNNDIVRRAGWWMMPLLLLSVGCAGKGDVSGTVTYQGKTVAFGSVMIVGGDNVIRYGEIKEDGSYVVEGVATGDAKVCVNSPDPRTPPLQRGQPEGKKDGAKGSHSPSIDLKKWFPIPRDYGDPQKTPLTTTVRRGPNSYDIPLTNIK